jgi:hypothetical protein
MNRAKTIKEALVQRPDEATVNRMWREIESHRYAHSVGLKRHYAFMLAAAVALISVAVTVFLWTRSEPSALLLTHQRSLPEQVVAYTPSRFDFVDGSVIRTPAHTHFDVLVNGKHAIEFALRKGKMSFQVTPGGHRRWTVHCGDIDVVVVGTIFDVTRTAEDITVHVQRGKVYVKGPQVPDGVQNLTAAMSLHIPTGHDPDGVVAKGKQEPFPNRDEIPLPPVEVVAEENSGRSPDVTTSPQPPRRGGASSISPPLKGERGMSTKLSPPSFSEKGTTATSPAETGGRGDLHSPLAPPSIAEEPSIKNRLDAPKAQEKDPLEKDWKTLARAGNFEGAFHALPNATFRTLTSSSWTAADLFLLSDVARITHHPRQACTVLGEIIRRYPADPRAGLAAYTLARVTTESLGQPVEGARYYEQALALGVSSVLRETALIRLIDTYRGTSPLKCRRYEDIYLAEFPGGRYAVVIKQSRTGTTP